MRQLRNLEPLDSLKNSGADTLLDTYKNVIMLETIFQRTLRQQSKVNAIMGNGRQRHQGQRVGTDAAPPVTFHTSMNRTWSKYWPYPATSLVDAEVDERLKKSDIPRLYRGATWENVEKKEMIGEYLQQEWSASMKRLPRGLVIMGAVGVGKTSLLALFWKWFVKSWAVTPRFISVAELFDLFYQGDFLHANQLKGTAVLLLDDVGREYGTDFPLSKLESFVEYRYSNLLPTFVTTNLSIADLMRRPGYEPIADRLNDSKWMVHYVMAGGSRRLR